MKFFAVAILTCFEILAGFARGEEVIPRICWFAPPPELERLVQNNDPGDNPFSMQSKAVTFRPRHISPSNYQAVSFSLRRIGVSIGNGKVLTLTPVSDAQLKDAILAATIDPRGSNGPKVEETSLANQKALKVHSLAAVREDIFWVRVRPNVVLEIRLSGATDSLLAGVYQWLPGLKIGVSDQPDPPPPAPLAQDETQLNLSQEEIIQRSGNVLDPRGPDIVLLTKDYLIIVSFLTRPNGTKGGADIIMYQKISNPDYAAAALRGDPAFPKKKDLFQSMNSEDIQKLLGHHTEEKKLTWHQVGDNHWKRSDDAEATLQSGIFFIVAPEKLADLSWFPK
jgi:hypothetical protein